MSSIDLSAHASALQGASSKEALAEAIRAAAGTLGFRYFALVRHAPAPGGVLGGALGDGLIAYPGRWIARYRAQGYGAIDPVVMACRSMARGFLWSEIPSLLTLTEAQTGLMAEARQYGLGDGYTVPLHVPGDRPGSCSFVVGAGEAIEPLALLGLPYLAGLAFEKARHLRDGQGPVVGAVALTQRQVDCLVLVARGKSDWEAAAILGLSRDTVHQHIEDAKRRFKVRSRLQLVVAALAQGVLSFSDVLPWARLVRKS